MIYTVRATVRVSTRNVIFYTEFARYIFGFIFNISDTCYAGLAQKTQPSFTHPGLYGFTQLEKHRKTGLNWVLL